MNDPQQKPIFFDETRRRWNLFSSVSIALTGICVLGAAAFLLTITHNPQLPALALTRAATALEPIKPDTTNGQDDVTRQVIKPGGNPRLRARNLFVVKQDAGIQEAKRRLAAVIKREETPQPIPATAISPGHLTGPVRAVFYVNWDKPSLDSLKAHISETSHLIPAWLHLSSDGSRLGVDQALTPTNLAPGTVVRAETNDDIALRLTRSNGVAILPMVQNADSSDFQPTYLHNLLSDPVKRHAVIDQLRNFVTKGHYQGVNIDFETDWDEDRVGMTTFMTELASVFHPLGLLVSQDVQLDSSSYDLKTLARVTDFLVPMLYDEHASGTTAGPIASQSWYASELATFMHKVPANKVVLGLGNYGYDWAAKNTDAQEVSFETAARLAQESQDGEDGVIRIDKKNLNPYFTYYDDSAGQGEKEIPHTVWLMDATTALNEARAALPYKTLGMALWRLGTEDPSLWTFFGKSTALTWPELDPQCLSHVTYTGFGTQFEGEGDVLDVVAPATPGSRTIVSNPKTKQVEAEHFITYPSQYVIRRRGLVDQTSGENTAKQIALTFDDGPDPRWTPQILDILHHYGVPATFFVVGENAEAHPGLLEREWNAGMEIGNHSFTHPDMDHVSYARTKLELDATQRVIEAMTGHMTTLFRAPNRADSEPTQFADFEPILDADKLGYLFIGEKIDPTDWQPGIKSNQIVASVLRDAHEGNCVLLHDAGGDTRAETVKALPLIIQSLKARGYHFVTVSQLSGKTRAQIFPSVTGRQLWTVAFDRACFDISYWTGMIMSSLFLVVIGLGIARVLIMACLAKVQEKREALRTFDPTYQPTVSVIIAAYNEAKVINKTIATLLASDYPNLEIVVVDDGSKDTTANTVRAEYGSNPQVTVLEKANGGKASALNLGIKGCRGEIVVALDADTVFAPDTVSRLVRHFGDPAVGAVSGNVKVGNRNNPLTIWQAVEYITSQNFDRRAFDLLNCITVVPGAIGAWRKDAIALAGMYSSQTLAEDTDLTFKVRKLGYRIVTDNSALAYTEAPDTLRDLAKQRFRWAFGTLQCLWKHRGASLNPRYGAFGLIALPSLWIFQIGFQALAPLVDLTIGWSILYNCVITPSFAQAGTVMLLGYWALFSTVELLGASIAFSLDREDKRLLIWLLLQRFVYRQLMYYVIVKSLLAAVRGSMVGWGKFERKGTVQQPTPIATASSDVPTQPSAPIATASSGTSGTTVTQTVIVSEPEAAQSSQTSMQE